MVFRFLNTIAQLTSGPNGSELWKFLDAIYEKPVPDPGGTLKVSYDNEQNVSVAYVLFYL
jgi:hypothetical protein